MEKPRTKAGRPNPGIPQLTANHLYSALGGLGDLDRVHPLSGCPGQRPHLKGRAGQTMALTSLEQLEVSPNPLLTKTEGKVRSSTAKCFQPDKQE